MKKIIGPTILTSLTLVLLFSLPGLAQSQPIQTGPGHHFACADYTQGKIFIVSPSGKVQWQYDHAPHSNDLWVLPNGNLLFSTGHGVREVTRAKKVVFNYESPSEIYACQRLPDGNTFIAECNAGRLLDVDPNGVIIRSINLLPPGKDGGHTYIRNARRLPDGRTLVCHYGLEQVKEYDPAGRCLRTIPAPGGPHSVVRLPNGNTLIACGDKKKNAQVIEVDPKNRVVWQVQSSDLPDSAGLYFMTGLQRLPNGNTVMSNWLGHGHFGQSPHIIEITRDKKIVWTFSDHKTMRTVASLQLLDLPGNPILGQILH